MAGLPGVGKTALALDAAHEAVFVRGWFPGGVPFVDLRGYDPDGQLTAEQGAGENPVFQSCAVPLLSAVARSLPSGLNATPDTPMLPIGIAARDGRSVARFHSRTVPSCWRWPGACRRG